MSDVYEPMIPFIDIDDVRRCLWGKSHFFDADTMRYFRTRLIGAHRAGDHLITYVSDRHPIEGRVYSVVYFDLTTGQDERLVKHSKQRAKTYKIFVAEWAKILDRKEAAK